MRIRGVAAALVVALWMSAPLFAKNEKPPKDPTGETPVVVVDSLGRPVGEVIEVTPARNTAFIKYTLPDGDAVFGSVNGASMLFGAAINPSTSLAAKVYFTTPDCSGDAYVLQAASPQIPQQLSRRQAIILDGLLLGPQTPPAQTDPNCPVPRSAGQWLYATDNLVCPLVVDPNRSPITFQAYFGFSPGPNGWCNATPTTFPGPLLLTATFHVYKRIEDLAAKFRPPFYIP